MTKLFVVLTSVAFLTGIDVAGQPKRDSLQGAWQTVEVTMTGPEARTIAIPEPRPNLIVFTTRHYSRVEIHADGRRPAPADMAKATADDLRAWGHFIGEAGTYELTGGTMTMRPLVANNLAAMAPDAFVTYSYKLAGDTLWVTFQKNQNGPIVNPVTVKAVRVE